MKFKNLKVETNFNGDATDLEWHKECNKDNNSSSTTKVLTPIT
jgi:hypothetical protein